MTDKNYITTPVGRWVQGSIWDANTTNMKGAPLTYKDGSPRVEYYVGLAIEKTNPEFNDFWAKVQAAALAAWPGGQSQAANFNWKCLDGDAADNVSKPGFAGHWVLRLTNGYAPQIVAAGGTQNIVNKDEFKRGDYARAVIDINGNGSTDDPGIFINFCIFERIGFGEAIVGGPNAAALLGNGSVGYVPAGMSNTPVAPTAEPAVPVQPPAAAPVQPAVQPAAASPATPVAAPAAPHTQILNTP